MKNTKLVTRILSVILIAITILFSISNITFAKINTSDFKPSELTSADTKDAFEMGNTIINVVRIIGIVVAIVGLLAIGIKFMTGSVEQKAEYKKTLLPYVIGCVIIFTVTTLIGVIADLVTQVEA